MCMGRRKDYRLVVHHGIDAKNLGWSLAVGVRGAHDAKGHQSHAPSALLSIHPSRMNDRVSSSQGEGHRMPRTQCSSPACEAK
jgi:hypothetical protein